MAQSAWMTLTTPAPDGADPKVTSPTPRVDGRRARAERSREAIADALLALVEEGDLRPTAGRIAERAGISERLIYHHFTDLDELLQVVAERQVSRARARLEPLDADATRPERVAAMVDQRADLHEWLTPIRRASQLQEPFSAELRAVRAQANTELRQQVAEQFAPELAARSGADRAELLAALDVALTWSTWHALRVQNELSVPTARRAVARTVTALLS
jgi:TetR/AcrR family transcriptional regulator, regulator of autoinduction and epiphytic fitness